MASLGLLLLFLLSFVTGQPQRDTSKDDWFSSCLADVCGSRDGVACYSTYPCCPSRTSGCFDNLLLGNYIDDGCSTTSPPCAQTCSANFAVCDECAIGQVCKYNAYSSTASYNGACDGIVKGDGTYYCAGGTSAPSPMPTKRPTPSPTTKVHMQMVNQGGFWLQSFHAPKKCKGRLSSVEAIPMNVCRKIKTISSPSALNTLEATEGANYHKFSCKFDGSTSTLLSEDYMDATCSTTPIGGSTIKHTKKNECDDITSSTSECFLGDMNALQALYKQGMTVATYSHPTCDAASWGELTIYPFRPAAATVAPAKCIKLYDDSSLYTYFRPHKCISSTDGSNTKLPYGVLYQSSTCSDVGKKDVLPNSARAASCNPILGLANNEKSYSITNCFDETFPPTAAPTVVPALFNAMSQLGQDSMVGIFATKRVTNSYFGPILQLRRSSDSVTADFDIDATGTQVTLTLAPFTSLADWLNSGDTAFVVTWYDQSPNSNDATQTTPSSQPFYNPTKGIVDFRTNAYLTFATPVIPQGNGDYSLTAKVGAISQAGYSICAANFVLFQGNNAVGQDVYFGITTYYDQLKYTTNWNSMPLFFGLYAANNIFSAIYSGTTNEVRGYAGGTLLSTHVTPVANQRNGGSNSGSFLGRSVCGSNTGYLNAELSFTYISSRALPDADRLVLEAT